MNLNQKRTLIAAAVIIAGMLLYPPFHRVLPNGMVGHGGHHWLFETMSGSIPLPTVDFTTLLVQWLGVLIIGGIVFFIFKDNEK